MNDVATEMLDQADDDRNNCGPYHNHEDRGLDENVICSIIENENDKSQFEWFNDGLGWCITDRLRHV